MYEWSFSPIRRIYAWGKVKVSVGAKGSNNTKIYPNIYVDILTLMALEDPTPEELTENANNYGFLINVKTVNRAEIATPFRNIDKEDPTFINSQEYTYPEGQSGIQEQITKKIYLDGKPIQIFLETGETLLSGADQITYTGTLSTEDTQSKLESLWQNFRKALKSKSIKKMAPFLTEEENKVAKDILKTRDLTYKLNATGNITIDIKNQEIDFIPVGTITLSEKECKAKPQIQIVYNKEKRQYLFANVKNALSILCNKPIPVSPTLSCKNCWLAPVSKKYTLKSSYVPYVVKTGVNGGGYVTPETRTHLQEMLKAAKAAGLTPRVSSSYRSYTVQKNLFHSYIRMEQNKGLSYSEAYKKANTYSAKPGQSEHQLGTTVDVVNCGYPCSLYSSVNTPLNNFFKNNAYKYGFVISYPSGSQAYTGYVYEPWHLRYIGVNLATELFNRGYLRKKGFYSYHFLLEKRMW